MEAAKTSDKDEAREGSGVVRMKASETGSGSNRQVRDRTSEGMSVSGDGPEAESKHKRPRREKAAIRAQKRKTLYARMVRWLLEHQGTPHSVALGFAVGMFVALTPTVGVQMILGAAIAQLLRANRLLPVALAWITNPFTIVPIYYFNYRVGQIFMGGDSEKGRQFIESLSKVSLLDFDHFISTMGSMLSKFGGIALVLWVGSLIVASVAAAISYPVVRRIVEVERKKLAKLSNRPLS